VPIVGDDVKFLLLGGTAVNENALLRFYVLHCVVLPLFLVVLVSIHIWRVRKDGGIYLGSPGGDEHPHRAEDAA
jgi:quinol-cytochrome oxidoreductase complex cytochrome b subunit